jgi:hypothetical protein
MNRKVNEDEIKAFRPLKHYRHTRCGERFATVKG